MRLLVDAILLLTHIEVFFLRRVIGQSGEIEVAIGSDGWIILIFIGVDRRVDRERVTPCFSGMGT